MPFVQSVDIDGPHCPPIPLISIVPPVIVQSQDTFITTIPPFTGAPEKLSVPPVIVRDE